MQELLKPEYTRDDFDAIKHAHDLLSKPTEHSAQLQFNIDFLKKQIHKQVLESHDQLLERVEDLSFVDGIVQDTSHNVRQLKTQYNLLREKIQIPFLSLQKTSTEIKELNKKIVLLRSISTFLKVYARLEAIIDDIDELPRAASYSYEIQSIIQDSDFEPIPMVQEELVRATEFHAIISQKGTEWLKEGIESNNQVLLGKSIHVFSNLRNIPQTVEQFFNEYQDRIQKESKNCFDMEAIKTQLLESRKTQTGQKQGNASALAEILWARIEKLTDCIYKYASNIQILETYLTRKKDNVTQISYLQMVLGHLQCSGLGAHYWQTLSQNFDKEIRAATKLNPVLLQILQFGYPKLLRVFTDLFSKIALLVGSENNDTAVLVKTLSSFENAYVSRTLTRMLDTVNHLIPEKGVTKNNPSTEEANKLCRSINSELNAVRFDEHLLQLVGKNVTKALNLFRSRLMQTLGTAPFSITGSSPGSAQIQKIDAVNCLHTLSESLWDMVTEFQDTVAEEILYSGAVATNDILVSVVEPLFLGAIQELELVLPKMHKEEYTTKNLVSKVDPQSLYLNEYTSKIRWVFRELISKLLCKNSTFEWYSTLIRAKQFCERLISIQLYHISLLSLNETGNLKIASDLTQVEYLLSQSLSLLGLHDTGPLFAPFKDFKKLMYFDLSEIRLLDHLDPIIVMNHTIARSGVIPSPMLLCNWTELEYVKWIDVHVSVDKRLLIKKCLDMYLDNLEKQEKKETCLEHPVLRTLLLDWESLDA